MIATTKRPAIDLLPTVGFHERFLCRNILSTT